MALPSVCWLNSATPLERRRNIELVPGERYPQMIQIASLAPTSR